MKKIGLTIYAFITGMLLFGTTAYAYIDPSVMTYLIQAVAGVVIAIGAVIGVYWRKAKKKAEEKFGVSSTKESESDDIIVKVDISDDDGKDQIR